MSEQSRPPVVAAGCWFAQPFYVGVELAVAAAVTAPYHLARNTVSDLGATTCTTVAYPFDPVAVCSPWHGLVNTALLLSGLLAVAGVLLLRRVVAPGGLLDLAAVLWLLVGAGAVGIAFVPVDVDLPLHSLAAVPAVLLHPVALLALGAALRARDLAAGSWLLAAGAVSALGVAWFVTALYLGPGLGLAERLVLWPAYLAAPAVGWSVLQARSAGVGHSRRTQDRPPLGPP